MNRKILVLFLLMVWIFPACSAENEDPLPEDRANTPKTENFITRLDGSGILVVEKKMNPQAIYYQVTANTTITKNGKEISSANLKIGDLVEVQVTGVIRESYPAQAEAASIEVFESKVSQPAQQALFVFQNQTNTVFIKHYQEKENIWEFVLQELFEEKEYRVSIDKKTHRVVDQE